MIDPTREPRSARPSYRHLQEEKAELAADAKKCLKSKGGSTYIDFGMLDNSLEKCMVWTPQAHYDQAKLDILLGGIFEEMRNSGSSCVNIAFSQLSDISKLPQGFPKPNPTSPRSTDPTLNLINQTYEVGNSGKAFFQYFSDKAKSDGLSLDLSFGGATSAQGSWNLGSDPAALAKDLTSFMKS